MVAIYILLPIPLGLWQQRFMDAERALYLTQATSSHNVARLDAGSDKVEFRIFLRIYHQPKGEYVKVSIAAGCQAEHIAIQVGKEYPSYPPLVRTVDVNPSTMSALVLPVTNVPGMTADPKAVASLFFDTPAANCIEVATFTKPAAFALPLTWVIPREQGRNYMVPPVLRPIGAAIIDAIYRV